MRKLCVACGAFSAAVFLAILFLPPKWGLYSAALCLPIYAAGMFLPDKIKRAVCLAAFFAGFGFLFCFLKEQTVIRDTDALAGTERRITARVTEYPNNYEDYSTVTLRLTDPALPAVKCMLSGDGLSNLLPGDEISLPVKFSSARLRYGEETDRYTAKGIFLRAYAREEPTVTGRWRLAFLYRPLALRRGIGAVCSNLFPADAGAFQKALLLGDKTDFYQNLSTYYAVSRAGLMHVAAVSGMHVSFLVGFLGMLIPNRRRLWWVTVPTLCLFMALSGFTPSVCRAVVMQIYLLSAPLVNRESDAPTSLSFILGVLLLINPYAAASVSLQLSFAATAGILAFAGPIYERLRSRLPDRKRHPRLHSLCITGAAAVSSSLGALILTLPLSALHFKTISLLAPVSNVLCLWLVSFLFVGGYLIVGLGSLFPGLGAFLAGLLSWGDRYVFTASKLLCRIPYATLYTTNPVFWIWLAAAYLLFLLAFVFREKKDGMSVLLPAAGSVALLAAFILLIRASWSKELSVTSLDTGDGSCTLLQSDEHTVVVDCSGRGGDLYPGETCAYTILGQCRRRADALILTDTSADLLNGAGRLLALMPVDELYLAVPSGKPENELAAVLRLAEEQGTDVHFLTRSEELQAGNMDIHLSCAENESGSSLSVSAFVPGAFVPAWQTPNP